MISVTEKYRFHIGQKGKITVELNARDHPVLEAFQRIVLPLPSSIRTRTRATNFSAEHTSAVWTLCALDARRQLLALGLPTGPKSSTIAPPAPDYSRIDYLRALVDADGSLGFTAKGYPFLGFVTASQALADYFCAEVLRLTGAVRMARRNKRDHVFNLMVAMEPACVLASLLYDGDPIAIPRKREAAGRLADWRRPATMRAPAVRRRWTPEEDAIVRRSSEVEAAEALGRTRASIAMRRMRLGRVVR
ncbi:hypothetical protein AB0I28_26650 [Phytomonospora sp. NPDC050363]|uniref:hypothetical protein n=1 Tax=Phytomonospora sp. NPDC050363 TaxID=3155642 RepID=UPI0033D67879